MFNPIELKWKGESRSVPGNRVLRMIASVEEVLTFGELQRYHERGSAPLAKIAMAYAVALRHIGFHITDEEVYASLFSDGGVTATVAVQGLLTMMMPPESMITGGDVAQGKSSQVETSSSKASTKRQRKRAG